MTSHDVREITIDAGMIRYREGGPNDGPALVFVHGLLVNGSLWRKVTPALVRAGYRCIVPDWPLGSHEAPMNEDADLTPEGIAQIVSDFIEALGLRDVTIIGNDSGGAITQLVAARHGERIARVVLTTCDAFEIFPPPLFNYLQYVTYVPGLIKLLAVAMVHVPALRRLPIAYGLLTKRRIPEDIVEGWIRPIATSTHVRRDVTKFIRGLSPAITMRVSKELADVNKPFLLVWSPEDQSFPVSLAHRLRRTLRDADLVLIEDALVFIAEDRPEALVNAIQAFIERRGSGEWSDRAPDNNGAPCTRAVDTRDHPTT